MNQDDNSHSDEFDFPLRMMAGVVARALEWPPIPTSMHGFLMASAHVDVFVSGAKVPHVRVFSAQCPKTLMLVLVEVHHELDTPSIAEFAFRAREAVSALHEQMHASPALGSSLARCKTTMAASKRNGKRAVSLEVASDDLERLPRFNLTKMRRR
mgnify:CR=1 FL=1